MKILFAALALFFAMPRAYAESSELSAAVQEMTQGSADEAAAVSEVVPVDDYLELVEVDREEAGAIQWDPASGRFLYLSTKEPPFLYLTGRLKPGYEISWNDQWIPTGREGRFQIKVNLPLEPKVIRLKLFAPNRTFRSLKFINYWLKIPVSMRLRIKEGDALIEKTLGFAKKYRSSAFVQLYSAERPVSLVDLDSQKHARITFRIFPPPIPEDAYDRWRITLRDAESRVVGEVTRLGAPPGYLDWRDVSTQLYGSGRYTYQIDLYRGDTVYEGASNEFVAVEGLSVLDRPYLPKVQFEPREELGYFSFRNAAGVNYSHFYVGADLSFVFFNRFILRGVGHMSLSNIDPQVNYSFTRLGGGFRFNARGESGVFGRPFLSRVDVLLSHTGYSIYPNAPVRRYTQIAVLVEPHLVLWRYHYVIPWVEFGSKPDFTQQRVSFGLNYNFFVRPWSVRFGMGIAYDWLFRHTEVPTMEFSTFRTLLTFTAFL